MKRLLICIAFSFSFIGITNCSNSAQDSNTTGQTGSKDSTGDYFTELLKVKRIQQEFHRSWTKSANKDSLLNAAASYIQYQVTHNLFDYWKGTPWEFTGTTDTPQRGSIACGYFVTTLLRDAGIKLNRTALAETYSEKMIKTLVQPAHIKKNVPFDLVSLVEDLKQKGNALYIVGLDLHTGFVYVENGEVWFAHSTVLSPGCVFSEKALLSQVLQNNRYTIYGSLTHDKTFLTNWIMQQ